MEVSSRTKEDHINISVRVPSGDGPYVKAKHIQLVERDPEGAIVWFWKAINEGDRVESALKDMAVAMRQLDRSEEAIEAIKSFRSLCPKTSQQSIDNLLMDLYKVQPHMADPASFFTGFLFPNHTRFTLQKTFFSKSYKVYTKKNVFFQIDWVPGNPINPSKSAPAHVQIIPT
ncbi:hypothetical protein Hanom_Chr15g01350391 [Helianthus anomalus]